MLQLHPTNRNAGYCCTGSSGMSVQVTFGQCACLFYFFPTSSPTSLPQGQQIYLPLCMFDYVALDQHTCLKPSNYVCNSFTRLAGMLQYQCFKQCFEPTGSCTRPPGTSVTVELDQACISVRVASTSRYV